MQCSKFEVYSITSLARDQRRYQ